MRILYISTPAFADCDFPLIKAFQEKGLDVTYLILMAPFSLRSTLVDIKHIYPKTGVFPATVYPELKKYEDYVDMSKVFVSNRTGCHVFNLSTWIEIYKLKGFIRKGNYNIIHCDTYLKGLRKGIYNYTKCFVTTFHDPIPHIGAEKWDNVKTRKDAIIGSEGLVLLNKKQLNEFCEIFNVDHNRILINRLGVYTAIQNFVKRKECKRNNILFFGRITPYKGLEYLCEAMKIVRKHITDATLTIAGGGKMCFDIEPYKKLGYIEIHNRYVGMEELAELLFRCDINVCPYTEATQSGVIMTSYALCKPVIATNVGGLGEMIDNGKSGILVPPKDTIALADAIINLLSDRDKIKEMSKYIQNIYFEGERSWDNIADNYIHYYKQLFNHKS